MSTESSVVVGFAADFIYSPPITHLRRRLQQRLATHLRQVRPAFPIGDLRGSGISRREQLVVLVLKNRCVARLSGIVRIG